MSVSQLTATISGGDATGLSNVINVIGNMAGLITPPAWTAAGLTFLGSYDGVNFFPIYDGPTERNYVLPAVQAQMALSLNDWLSVAYLKLRSGTGAAPVVQGADRVFQILLAS